MKRITRIVPGYDCRAMCPHEPKGDHGIHGSEWFYAITDGNCATSLTVYAHIYPPTVAGRIPFKEPEGVVLSLHCAFDTDEEALRTRYHPEQKCDLVEGGYCSDVTSSFLAAQNFFEKYGNPTTVEQSERFWEALEDWHQEHAAKARRDRADLHWSRCECCDGRGIVRSGIG